MKPRKELRMASEATSDGGKAKSAENAAKGRADTPTVADTERAVTDTDDGQAQRMNRGRGFSCVCRRLFGLRGGCVEELSRLLLSWLPCGVDWEGCGRGRVCASVTRTHCGVFFFFKQKTAYEMPK